VCVGVVVVMTEKFAKGITTPQLLRLIVVYAFKHFVAKASSKSGTEFKYSSSIS
jgi:hypothetical protein